MTDMRDQVTANSTLIPDFSVYEDNEFMFQLDPHAVLGNDLKVTVDFEPSVSNYTQVIVYDTENINVDFRLDRGNIRFRDIHFSGENAVAIDFNDQVVFMNCEFVSFTNLLCTEGAVVETAGHSITLKKDLNTVFDWLFSWGVDVGNNLTFAFIYDGKNTTTTITIPGAADDMIMSTIEGEAYLAAAFAELNLIKGWKFDRFDPKTRVPVPDMSLGLVKVEYFCPMDIDFDPEDEDVLEVLSVCPDKDQRIFRFRYPPRPDPMTKVLKAKVISTVPINFAYQNPQYCSMGQELVVFS